MFVIFRDFKSDFNEKITIFHRFWSRGAFVKCGKIRPLVGDAWRRGGAQETPVDFDHGRILRGSPDHGRIRQGSPGADTSLLGWPLLCLLP